MKHKVKSEPTIKLELTLEEFEHLYSASCVEVPEHKQLHKKLVEKPFNQKLAENLAEELEEIHKSIK